VPMTDALAEPPLSVAEAERRLPSLECIADPQLRALCRDLSRFAPAYVWTRPGSYAGYHNAHRHGLWLHTLKVSTAIERLGDSWVERGLLDERDLDHAHAAAILHDQAKDGDPPGETAPDHDCIMADGLADERDVPDAVVRAVRAHMGPWGEGPAPRLGSVGRLLHIADMVASADDIRLRPPEPVPEELTPFVVGGGGDE